MLASITPLGERGRGRHWGATVAAYLAGSVVGGGALGGLLGLAGAAAAGVRTQRQLLELHRGLARWRAPARWGAVAMQAAMLVLALALS